MSAASRTLWMRPETPETAETADMPATAPAAAEQAPCTACAHCPSAASDIVTRPAEAMACEAPQLEGDRAELDAALAALRTVADTEGNLVDTQRFSRLRVADGEAELTLTFPRTCSPTRVLAEGAFQALRQALPDTDIYVHMAG